MVHRRVMNSFTWCVIDWGLIYCAWLKIYLFDTLESIIWTPYVRNEDPISGWTAPTPFSLVVGVGFASTSLMILDEYLKTVNLLSSPTPKQQQNELNELKNT
uniref:Uncharacterized protein n=1 Tax=Opuntia streptacantha TaxID=393608 RepID=A0A7C8ZWF5_OPUST